MQKKLCEISSPKQWKTISSDMLIADGYPVYGANGIIGYYNEYNHECETLLITCRGATCGALNICQPYSYVNGNAMALDNLSDDVDIKYLYYYLLNRGLSDVITGSAQPQIVRLSLDKVIVEYPSLSKQKEIASNLNRIEELISFRTSQLSKLDELVKSRFIELFGDVALNPNGYPVRDFDEISVLITDGEHATPRRTEEGIYLLSARNVLNHTLQLDDVDYIDEEEYNRIARRVIPQAGDVLISCSGSIGRCCVVPDGLKFQMVRSAALIRFDDTINPIFAEWLITSDDLQRQIAQSATQSSQANLFQGKIRKLHGYVPPMELQNQFAAFIEQTDKLKFEVKEALEKLETLKKSLMQQYFG